MSKATVAQLRVGVLMDPIQAINVAKDTSFALLLAAQSRGHELFYLEADDIFLKTGEVWSQRRRVLVDDNPDDWFRLTSNDPAPLAELDIVIMRLDPPVDDRYAHVARLLAIAERHGVTIVNAPGSLIALNEKLYAQHFPQFCPRSLVSRDVAALVEFVDSNGDCILKPLDGMGGRGVFRTDAKDPNRRVIAETLTGHGQAAVVAQEFLPEIRDGDKRILVIAGEAYPYSLARIPGDGEHRGNLAAGGVGEGRDLTEADREICATVGPSLVANGILFAGLDVIGTRLTEINITSPTCVRELTAIYGDDIAGQIIDAAVAEAQQDRA